MVYVINCFLPEEKILSIPLSQSFEKELESTTNTCIETIENLETTGSLSNFSMTLEISSNEVLTIDINSLEVLEDKLKFNYTEKLIFFHEKDFMQLN